jgi:hypothetical protein
MIKLISIFFYLIFSVNLIFADNGLFQITTDGATTLEDEKGYHCFSTQPVFIPIRLNVFYKVQDATPAFIAISEGGKDDFDKKSQIEYELNKESQINTSKKILFYRNARYKNNKIQYNLCTDLTLKYFLQPYPNIYHKNETLLTTLDPRENQWNTVFYLYIPENQYIEPGIYRDVVTLNLFLGNPENAINSEGVSSIEYMFEIHVYNSSAISFNNRYHLTQYSKNIEVYTNEPYELEFYYGPYVEQENNTNLTRRGAFHNFPSVVLRSYRDVKVLYKSFP